MRILRLTVKKKWFDMLKSGIKKHEYREDKQWIRSRLFNKDGTKKEYDLIEFKNGYSPTSPKIYFKWNGWDIGPAVPEWSDDMKGEFVRIKTNTKVEYNG